MKYNFYGATIGRFEGDVWRAIRSAQNLHQPDTLRYYLQKWLTLLDHPERKAFACLKTGKFLEEEGCCQEAVDLYRKGLGYNPSHPSLCCRLNSRLAFALVQLGLPAEAEIRARSALRIFPDNGTAHLHLGLALEAQGAYEEALASYQAGIQAPVVERDLFERIHLIYLQSLEDRSGATKEEVRSRLPAPSRLLASVFTLARRNRFGQFQAAALQSQLWVLDRSWEEIYLPLLRTLTATLETPEQPPSLSWQGLWIKVNPGIYRLTARGWTLLEDFFHQPPPAGKPLDTEGFLSPEGILFFDSYLEAKFTYARTLYHIIKKSVVMGEEWEAEPYIDQLFSLADFPYETALYWLQMGGMKEQISDFQAALDCYREGLAIDNPGAKTAYFLHNNVAYCHLQLGQPQAAERLARQAIAIDTEPHNAHKNLGIALEGQGRWPEAAEAYRQAVIAWPADRRAYDHLHRLLEDHPSLAASHPQYTDFLEDAALAVVHGRRIKEAAHIKRVKVPLPAPVRTLVTAMQITRATGRETFTPGELRKRMQVESDQWTVVYAPALRTMSSPSENQGDDEIYREIFAYRGLTEIQFSDHGKRVASLVEPLLEEE